MSNSADNIALKSLLVVGTIIASLVGMRSCKWELPKATPVAVSQEPAPFQSAPTVFHTPAPRPSTPFPAPAPPSRIEPVEPIAVRPHIYIPPPPVSSPPPNSFSIHVEPRKWSAPFEVPQGRRGKITFSLGRMEVEINGKDAGILYRNPLMERSDINPNALRVKPFAMFDRTPRTLTFGPEVRTLRFWSLEKTSEDILVELEE